MTDQPNSIVAERIWRARYRLARPGHSEQSLGDTWERVARTIAAGEGPSAGKWTERYLEILRAGEFLPGGRIIAGAGTPQTLLNCFMSGPLTSGVESLYEVLKESALALQMGGGVGFDLTPLGQFETDPVAPAEALPLLNDTADLISTRGGRRGAMMASLACDHPGLLRFVRAKLTRPLPRLTLAVQVSDAFAEAAQSDSGSAAIHEAWDAIAAASLACGDPGILFIDRINRENNLAYCERLSATNPCGEAPLPPYGGCDLGSVNLVALVREPFTPRARIDEDRLAEVASVAVRLLDSVLDVTEYPRPAFRSTALASRRIGIGLTGLGDALVMLGIRYGDPAAVAIVERIGERLRDAAYEASTALAAERGPFPLYSEQPYLGGPFAGRLPADVRARIRRHGIRNSHLLAVAPAGSVSLLAGNVSSGIEPPVAPAYRVRITLREEGAELLPLEDAACVRWRERGNPGLPPAFQAATDIPAVAHLAMQSALQRYVDGAISKTVMLPATADQAAVRTLLGAAWHSNVKGLTVFRQGTDGAQLTCRAECS